MTAAELKRYYSSKEFKDNCLYDGDDLGVKYNREGSLFKVWAPTASEVSVNLYTTGSEEEGGDKIGTYVMEKGDRGVFFFDAKDLGDLKNKYYTYNITVDGVTNETTDIYAKACGVNSKRSMVVDLEATNPPGFEKDKRLKIDKSEAIIYELHIKDFSSDVHSGIKEEYRGKYMAFTEKDTWLDGDEKTAFPTCVNYLKELGITYVHLLPSFDFGSIDEANDKNEFNWGYDPVSYNIPEGSYSTNPFDGNVRIREYKEMVKALHEAGIGVVMDVVYNHTFSLDSSFQKTVPYYYYRLNEDGSISNGSACGNETASEHEMFRKFMVDSIKYWAKEYHLDGFRFDLMGLHDTETMKAIREGLNELPDGEEIIMYGEPWVAGPTAMEAGYISSVTANEAHIDEDIYIFSDSIRDAIKGSVFEGNEPAYVNSKDSDSINFVNDVKNALTLKRRVSYTSAHDNYTLYDKLILSTDIVDKTDKEHMFDRNEVLIKMNKLAAGIVFTSQGMSFFQAGEEFLRTKQGISDSYKSPIAINQLDWQRAYENRDIVEYYKELINIRKKYSILSNADGASEFKFFKINGVDDNVISFKVNDKLMVIYNPNTFDIDISSLDYKNKLLPSKSTKKVAEGKSVTIMEL